MKTLAKIFLVVLVLVIMSAATILSASAAPVAKHITRVVTKNEAQVAVKSDSASEIVFTTNANTQLVPSIDGKMVIDFNHASDSFGMLLPWTVQKKYMFTPPSARRNNLC